MKILSYLTSVLFIRELFDEKQNFKFRWANFKQNLSNKIGLRVFFSNIKKYNLSSFFLHMFHFVFDIRSDIVYD